MGFPVQTPRWFTQAGIESGLASGQRGCYGIYNKARWIYVGKADDLRKRVLEHVAGENTCVVSHAPTHVVTVLSNDPVLLEKQLILEYAPVCNVKVG